MNQKLHYVINLPSTKLLVKRIKQLQRQILSSEAWGDVKNNSESGLFPPEEYNRVCWVLNVNRETL